MPENVLSLIVGCSRCPKAIVLEIKALIRGWMPLKEHTWWPSLQCLGLVCRCLDFPCQVIFWCTTPLSEFKIKDHSSYSWSRIFSVFITPLNDGILCQRKERYIQLLFSIRVPLLHAFVLQRQARFGYLCPRCNRRTLFQKYWLPSDTERRARSSFLCIQEICSVWEHHNLHYNIISLPMQYVKHSAKWLVLVYSTCSLVYD